MKIICKNKDTIATGWVIANFPADQPGAGWRPQECFLWARLFSGCLATLAVSGRTQSSLGSHRWGAVCYSPAGSASSVLDSGSNEKCIAILVKSVIAFDQNGWQECLLLSVRLDTTAVFGAIDLRMFSRKDFYDGP